MTSIRDLQSAGLSGFDQKACQSPVSSDAEHPQTELCSNQLEQQYNSLRAKIDAAVQLASLGQSDGSDIPPLTREAAGLLTRIESAKQAAAAEKAFRDKQAKENAATELHALIPRIAALRESFFPSISQLAIKWGELLDLQAKAFALLQAAGTGYVGPSDWRNVAALEVTAEQMLNAMVAQSFPFTDGNWKTQFSLTPRRRSR